MDRPWIAPLVAFASGGAVAAVVLLLVTSDPTPSSPAFASASSVRDDFVGSWEAWRTRPLAYSERVVRDDGTKQTTEIAEVSQEFPRRTVTAGGLRSESVERASAVDDEVAEFVTRTSGQDAVYRLSDLGDGCYRLRRVRADPRPQWGDRTDYCFDPASHLLRREVREDARLVITTTRELSG